jgi:hypothetical protein
MPAPAPLPPGVIRIAPGHFAREGIEPMSAAAWAVASEWLEQLDAEREAGFSDASPARAPAPLAPLPMSPPEPQRDPDADLDAVLAAVGWERA